MLLRGIASRYSEALVLLADKAGGPEAIEKDLELVIGTVEGHAGLKHNLFSPTVATAVKRSVLSGIFKGKVSDTVLHFLFVLVDKGREQYLSLVLEVFRTRLREQRGEIECRVRSAKKLTAAQRKDLEAQLEGFTGQKVILSEEVDPDLLAGFVVFVGDQVIDVSFRNQLNEIRDRLARV